jgi:hypothetical protein
MIIDIRQDGKKVAEITATKISCENGLVEYEVAKQFYAMGRIAAIREYGTIKLAANLSGPKLDSEIRKYVAYIEEQRGLR